jgi:hypothetical protein
VRGPIGRAHKFTGANDSDGLSALSRNFLRGDIKPPGSTGTGDRRGAAAFCLGCHSNTNISHHAATINEMTNVHFPQTPAIVSRIIFNLAHNSLKVRRM